MNKLLCSLIVCLLFALCFAACSSTADGPPVTANSNQAVVTNANTAASTANANLAAAPPATTAPVTSPTLVTNANTNAAPTAAATPAKSPTAAAVAIDFTATRAQYAQHCAMCHGAGGEGMKMGTVNYPSLKGGSSATHSDAQLTNYITNGHEGMPAFKGKLSAAQISTMVRYIRQELPGKK
ncbi:MAG TPA: cytochrome c [Pyrinomonadaceae bacterium]|nr:cytochrome c [Pyrinomonadaceae bacterium]